jgi:hypothetical protein
LDSTRAFYLAKGREWLGIASSTEYLLRAEMAIQGEMARIDSFMNSCTRAKVAQVCHDTLFVAHMRDVLTQPSGLETTLWAFANAAVEEGEDRGGAGAGAGAASGGPGDKVRPW